MTDGQWRQVRTPAFKAWFGDWEKAARKRFLEGAPVASMRGDEVPRFARFGELAAWAATHWKDTGRSVVRNSALWEVTLDRRAAK